MTDKELQLLLAKMLPEKIIHNSIDDKVHWLNHPFGYVRETEWLHVCWLVEQTVNNSKDSVNYANELIYIIFGFHNVDSNQEWVLNRWALMRLAHATWQQRAQALAEVKGLIQ